MSQENKSQSSTGLEPNIAGLLCYLFGWITGIIFLIIEKKNATVRFHAIQSIVVFGAFTVVTWILAIIPIVGAILGSLLGIAAFILWIVLMVKAYKGQKWVLPVAGPIAEKNSKPAGG
ncbi:MAG TPA: DUF4870 domain-containing protein [Dehalococcoidales bacterium]|nr:DUF4870 domain-containing protein [Dehalococcoidales bacterium]